MRREYHWPNVANNVYTTVWISRKCAQKKLSNNHRRPLQLYLASGPMELFVMHILGPLPKTLKDNYYVLLMKNCYSKLARAVTTSVTIASHTSSLSIDNWIMPYGILTQLLTDNEKQLFSKFLESLCALLGTKHLTTTAFHPQTNGQAKQFIKTTTSTLPHYVPEHQRDWNLYVQSLTYLYSTKVHRTTNLPSISLVLSQQPLDLRRSMDWLRYLLTPQRLHLTTYF